MSKRYYLSDIIGTGTEEDPYRVAAGDFSGIRIAADIPTGPDGRPLHTQALCLVASKDHARIRDAVGVDALPDFPLDGKVNAIGVATLAVTKAMLRRRNLPDAIVDGKDGYRELIRAVGREFKADFDENTFDVTDV